MSKLLTIAFFAVLVYAVSVLVTFWVYNDVVVHLTGLKPISLLQTVQLNIALVTVAVLLGRTGSK